MKKIYLLCLFLFTQILIFGQNKPIINVGAGLSYVNTNSNYGGGTHNISGHHFIIEKPILFKKDKNVFLSLLPGVRYTQLHEYFETSGLGHWYSYEHLLEAAFIQAKVLFNSKLKSNTFIYTGVNVNTYFWSAIRDYENPDYEIPEYLKSSFSRGTLGIVLGIQSKVIEQIRFRPTFELTYYPKYGEFGGENKNSLCFSIIFGFVTKKELPD